MAAAGDDPDPYTTAGFNARSYPNAVAMRSGVYDNVEECEDGTFIIVGGDGQKYSVVLEPEQELVCLFLQVLVATRQGSQSDGWRIPSTLILLDELKERNMVGLPRLYLNNARTAVWCRKFRAACCYYLTYRQQTPTGDHETLCWNAAVTVTNVDVDELPALEEVCEGVPKRPRRVKDEDGVSAGVFSLASAVTFG